MDEIAANEQAIRSNGVEPLDHLSYPLRRRVEPRHDATLLGEGREGDCMS